MTADVRLRIGVLGPLLGTWDGAVMNLPRGRARVLLAVLAMSAGRPVSVARLAELIWAEEQPERARSSLQTLVARLRGMVPGTVVTTADGYLLDIDPDNVDLLRFRRLVGAANAASEPGAVLTLLDDALGLWRGEPLGDLRSATLDRDVVPGLVEERLAALEQRAELELTVGRYDRVIAELQGLISQYPLREPLWGQLMRALNGAGRPAEAIQQYHRARGILAAELGVDPSPGLHALYQQLLRAEPRGAEPKVPPARAATLLATSRMSSTGTPRQLPAPVAGFAGRAGALKILTQQAAAAAAVPGAVVISAIGGMAGVGKTALAVHWAHQEATRFPGGQLYADLRGFGPSGEPASPAEVIRAFLDALGVPAGRIPPSLEAQSGLYRTLLADRRVLIVLDNARDAAQVRPLLPGSPGCMVVITSRSPLSPVAAGLGARLISLDVLTGTEAAELLSARLGAVRVAAEPETAAELVALCGRLPLALAITAARAAARPRLPLAVFAAELRDARHRLEALDAGDPASNLRAVFSWSCQALSSQAASLFRLLGIHPGPDISLPAATSLAGTASGQTTTAMHELAALHLVTEHRPGRFVLHDLVRDYAADQAFATVPVSQRHAAAGRVLDHYLRAALSAHARLNPQDHPLASAAAHDLPVAEGFGNRQQAMSWLDAEYQVLLAMTGVAASTGFDTHAWQLPAAIARYVDWHGHWSDWAGLQRTALAAAHRLGDKYAQACVLRAAGGMSLSQRDCEQARTYFRQALDLYTEIDHLTGMARVHGGLAMSFAIQDRYREALAHSERGLELSGQAGHPHVHAGALNRVGWHAAHLGDYQRALASCQQALNLLQALGSPHQQAHAWDSLGYINMRQRHYARSIDCYRHAIGLLRATDNHYELAETLNFLGDAYNAARQPAAARDSWQQALTILDDLRHPTADSIRAKMDRQDVPDQPAPAVASSSVSAALSRVTPRQGGRACRAGRPRTRRSAGGWPG